MSDSRRGVGEVADRMNEVRVWNGESLEAVGRFLTRHSAYGDVDVSPDGSFFALALPQDDRFEVWSIEALAGD